MSARLIAVAGLAAALALPPGAAAADALRRRPRPRRPRRRSSRWSCSATGTRSRRRVSTAATSVRVGGRRCAVGERTPLAALVRSRPGPLRFRDFGACSSRARDAAGILVTGIGPDRNRGQRGWVYKVGRRAATAGAGDTGGPFGRGRLRARQRVTWFYCVRAADCQRTLEVSTKPATGGIVATVRGYDDDGDGVPVVGATVTAGAGHRAHRARRARPDGAPVRARTGSSHARMASCGRSPSESRCREACPRSRGSRRGARRPRAGGAGCGFGEGGRARRAAPRRCASRATSATQQLGSVRLDKVHEGDTVMRMLRSKFDVTTRFGGRFVQSIDGLAGEGAGGQVDWFFFVNGVEADKGAAEWHVSPGDRIQWDRRDWGAAMRVPAIVGAYPEPFTTATGGKRRPVRIECEDVKSTACTDARDRLERAGVPTSGSSIGAPGTEGVTRLVVAHWPRARGVRGASDARARPGRERRVRPVHATTARRSSCSTSTATRCGASIAATGWGSCSRSSRARTSSPGS